ncbi:MAG: hypothetical protein CMI18_07260 [Opitutaceae bacterium]|nr:hypothetical protein [Opitutaceae bacterium]|tara:strand:+ start:1517 stop:3574 length:2058 start_codon:yes stop_codon:yes gene_type:complete
MKYPNLFSPFKISNIELRNRFVFQPHFTALGTLDGMPSDGHVAYHEERARGGVALIIIESQAIHPTGKMSRRFINAWDPAVIPMLRKLTEAVHAHGAKIFSQLTHGGHTSLEQPPHIMWAPTQMPEPSSHFSSKAIDEDDIAAVIEGFATSARNALEAGFDGIEIKVGHDGLLRSFASPFFNHRVDRYGGSFENRMRLSLEVLEAIHKATDDSCPVGIRICINEFTTFGYGLDYGMRMVECLEKSGLVDYMNSDAGSFSSYWMEIPPAAVAAEDFQKLNDALKRGTRLPVIAFGRVSPTQRAEDMIREGTADLIGHARQLIADPETPNKLKQGRTDLVRLCVACNDACIYQVGQEKAIRCIHNPSAGQEREINERLVASAEAVRHVVVVGGGPAGLKVAEIAAKRGHKVTLLEREDALGGQIRLAAKQPEHEIIGEVTRYLEASVSDLGVDIQLGVTATPESLQEFAADVIVIATGSEPNLPNRQRDEGKRARQLGRQVLPSIPGLDHDFVVSSDQILSAEVEPSGNVLVVDDNGHWEAAGTAEYLSQHNCRVQVIASHSLVGEDIEAGTRTLFYRRAAIKGIQLRPSTSLVEVGNHRVKVTSVFSSSDPKGWNKYLLVPGDEEWIEDIDWVVPVIGRRSREDLYLALKESFKFKDAQIERVGDCVVPRLIQSIISEAFTLAATL